MEIDLYWTHNCQRRICGHSFNRHSHYVTSWHRDQSFFLWEEWKITHELIKGNHLSPEMTCFRLTGVWMHNIQLQEKVHFESLNWEGYKSIGQDSLTNIYGHDTRRCCLHNGEFQTTCILPSHQTWFTTGSNIEPWWTPFANYIILMLWLNWMINVWLWSHTFLIVSSYIDACEMWYTSLWKDQIKVRAL